MDISASGPSGQIWGSSLCELWVSHVIHWEASEDGI